MEHRGAEDPAGQEHIKSPHTQGGSNRSGVEQQLRDVLVPLVALMRRFDQASDITTTHITVLNLIRRQPLTIGQLAHALSISQPAASQHVKALLAQRLIASQPHPQDSRAKLLVVTDTGRAVAQRANRSRNAQLRALTEQLTPEERAAIAAALPALSRLGSFDPETRP